MTMIGFNGLYRALRRATMFCGLALISATTQAAPGGLDATFAAGNGVAFTNVNNFNARSTGIALTPDGKIVIGVEACGVNGVCALRYGTDGLLDASFNGTGRSVNVLPQGSCNRSYARAVAALPDGKVLTMFAGDRTNPANGSDTQIEGVVLVKFNADGSVDTGFGNAGQVVVEPDGSPAFGSPADFRGFGVQPDGKIVLGGLCNGVTCSARLMPNGSFDVVYGTNGIARYTTVSTPLNVRGVAILADGKMFLSGSCTGPNGTQSALCALKLQANGDIDTTFLGSGLSRTVNTPAGTPFNASEVRIAVGANGSILLVGSCNTTPATSICMARLQPNGSIDTTFSNDGIASGFSAGSHLINPSVLMDGDGRIVVGLTCTNTTTSANSFCMFRFNNDGSLDTSFGSTGRVISSFSTGAGATDTLAGIAQQRDGKFVVGGYCTNDALFSRICVARYEGGPTPNRACSMDIDGDGKVTGTIDSLIHARIAMGITGNAVIGGITFPAAATRTSWPAVRDFLVTQCGMSLVP
jgi:uncharacterized delta-60 repeat protein